MNNHPTPNLTTSLEPEPEHCQRNDGTIFRLPVEVSDLILSWLSPAALDTAELTCKIWRRNIMRNNWALSTVLNMANYVRSRIPLRILDRESSLLATYEHFDSWRRKILMQSSMFTTIQNERHFTTHVLKFRFFTAARIGS